ncbi:hypothetical protein D3C72_1411730 [compost metagenome]
MEQAVGDNQLPRINAPDIGEKPGQRGFRQTEDAGGNIDPGECKLRLGAAANTGERHQIVGFRRRQQFFFGQRAGGDKPHDITFDHGFRSALLRLGRVFHLFADGDAIAAQDELLQVVIRRMDGNAAHGNIVPHVLAAFRQRDAERTGGFDRIVKEQFVKIAHAVEQQRTGIVRLDLDILLHHRSGRRAALFRDQGSGCQNVRQWPADVISCCGKGAPTLAAMPAPAQHAPNSCPQEHPERFRSKTGQPLMRSVSPP